MLINYFVVFRESQEIIGQTDNQQSARWLYVYLDKERQTIHYTACDPKPVVKI